MGHLYRVERDGSCDACQKLRKTQLSEPLIHTSANQIVSTQLCAMSVHVGQPIAIKGSLILAKMEEKA